MIPIFILAGQSNMAGRAKVPPPDSRWYRMPREVRLFEDGEWRTLMWKATFGPELGLAHAWSAYAPGQPLVLCKVARGGANLFYDWNPDGQSQGAEDAYRGPLYPGLLENLRQVQRRLAGENQVSRVEAAFWMQGERDSVFEHMANAYYERMEAFIRRLREDVGEPDLPFIQGEISPRVYDLECGVFQHGFRRVVQEAQRRLSTGMAGVGWTETRDLPQDDQLHFNTAGQIELGRRFFETYRQMAARG